MIIKILTHQFDQTDSTLSFMLNLIVFLNIVVYMELI